MSKPGSSDRFNPDDYVEVQRPTADNPSGLPPLDPGLEASLKRGLAESAAGDVHDLGDFTQYAVAEIQGQPSAWKSLPGAVRFAVWLWTVATIASLAAGLVGGVIFGLLLGGGQ